MKFFDYKLALPFKWLFLIIILIATLIPVRVTAGWRVIPIRLDFDQRTKSGQITLTNDGETTITFSIEAAEWSQDEHGQDQYNPTQDLVFFPKILTIEPNTERIVRTGIRVPAVSREKTYRLFIREAAEPQKAEGTAVAIAIKFGVPIFVKPAKEEIKGELLPPVVADDQVRVTISNTGNGHFRIGTIRLTGENLAGEPIFSQEINGWYLLAGSTREFSTPVTAEICNKLKTIDIQMHADRLYLTRKIDVDPSMCTSP